MQNAATAHGAPPIALSGAVSTTIMMPPNPAARRTHEATDTWIPINPLRSTTHSGIAAARIAPRLAVTAVSATVASPCPPTSSSTPATARRRSCTRVGRGTPTRGTSEHDPREQEDQRRSADRRHRVDHQLHSRNRRAPARIEREQQEHSAIGGRHGRPPTGPAPLHSIDSHKNQRRPGHRQNLTFPQLRSLLVSLTASSGRAGVDGLDSAHADHRHGRTGLSQRAVSVSRAHLHVQGEPESRRSAGAIHFGWWGAWGSNPEPTD